MIGQLTYINTYKNDVSVFAMNAVYFSLQTVFAN